MYTMHGLRGTYFTIAYLAQRVHADKLDPCDMQVIQGKQRRPASWQSIEQLKEALLELTLPEDVHE